ncbi:MAG: hypothetical protein KKG93_12160 [Bacteroidetes bacterium]|nr:hypothetical protein [Bacteroidota bacterium]
MFKKVLFTLTILLISSLAFSQNVNYNYSPDWDHDWSYDFWEWSHSRPLIELNYGLGEPKHDKFLSNLAKVGISELKLGYSDLSVYDKRNADYILELEDHYVFGSKLSDKVKQDKSPEGEIKTDMIRFGFGERKGYGYGTEYFSIIPFIQSALALSKLQNIDESLKLINAADYKIAERYLNEFRFGTVAEAGVKIELASMLAVNASYEAAVIYPRYLVWKQLGSYALEFVGLHAIDDFVEEIMDRTPFAGPIVSILLKSGYSYAFYMMKKENMNWPFKTETPLTYETMKLGVTFTF